MGGVLRAACCCPEDCTDCEVGVDTPRRFRITLSGFNLCGCVSDTTAADASVQWTTNPSPALQASYILRQDIGRPCIWWNGDNEDAVSGEWKVYDQDGCVGNVIHTNSLSFLRIQLTISGGGTTMDLVMEYTSSGDGDTGIYAGSSTTATPCGGTTILTNSANTCNVPANHDGGGQYSWGDGYSYGANAVTVTPL